MTPPRGLAAATVFPGGYGIRPYGGGGGVLDDPGGLNPSPTNQPFK